MARNLDNMKPQELAEKVLGADWEAFNAFLTGMRDFKKLEALLDAELSRQGFPRPQYVKRLYSRFSRMRRVEEQARLQARLLARLRSGRPR